MTYGTLMVHLQLGQSNADLLRVAGDFAERFGAGVIGIATCQPLTMPYNDICYVSGAAIEQDREEIESEIAQAEAEFRSALLMRVEYVDWRSTVTFTGLANALAREARCADIVMTGVTSGASSNASRHTDIGDLIMQLGRPVLIVPAAVETLKPDRIIIAWKDTRETRRAACDALPLLKKAAQVVVVEIAPDEELAAAETRLKDVVSWLKRHGVNAASIASPSTSDDATRLSRIAGEQGADILVAGAYGHSRLREWILGGVTRDLLFRAERCSFMSH